MPVNKCDDCSKWMEKKKIRGQLGDKMQNIIVLKVDRLGFDDESIDLLLRCI